MLSCVKWLDGKNDTGCLVKDGTVQNKDQNSSKTATKRNKATSRTERSERTQRSAVQPRLNCGVKTEFPSELSPHFSRLLRVALRNASNLPFLLSELFKVTDSKRAVDPECILFLCLLFNSLFDITPIFSLGSFEHLKRILTHILTAHRRRGRITKKGLRRPAPRPGV